MHSMKTIRKLKLNGNFTSKTRPFLWEQNSLPQSYWNISCTKRGVIIVLMIKGHCTMFYIYIAYEKWSGQIDRWRYSVETISSKTPECFQSQKDISRSLFLVSWFMMFNEFARATWPHTSNLSSLIGYLIGK